MRTSKKKVVYHLSDTLNYNHKLEINKQMNDVNYKHKLKQLASRNGCGTCFLSKIDIPAATESLDDWILSRKEERIGGEHAKGYSPNYEYLEQKMQQQQQCSVAGCLSELYSFA